MKQVVAALIIREDRLLVCQRTKYQPMPLKWEFPGGKIEEGEEPVEALRRELDEELGIQPEVGPEVARLQHFYKRGGAVELRFYRVDSFAGEPENRIFREIRWVLRGELAAMDFLDADLQLVRDIADGKIV